MRISYRHSSSQSRAARARPVRVYYSASCIRVDFETSRSGAEVPLRWPGTSYAANWSQAAALAY